jgi:hypothetical protein
MHFLTVEVFRVQTMLPSTGERYLSGPLFEEVRKIANAMKVTNWEEYMEGSAIDANVRSGFFLETPTTEIICFSDMNSILRQPALSPHHNKDSALFQMWHYFCKHFLHWISPIDGLNN